jgi:hypothetical protein
MHDKATNIDILFRNGLKDLEALPPECVWDSIAPVLWAGRVRRNWLNAAASVAAVTALASAAWLTGSLVNMEIMPSALTLNQESRPASLASTLFRTTGRVDKDSPAIISSETELPARLAQTYADEGIGLIPPNIGFSLTEADDEELQNLLREYEALNSQVPLEANIGTIFTTLWQLPGELTAVPENKVQRWSLGAGLSPAVVFKQGASANPDLHNMVANENMLVSYSGGLSVSYNFNKRFSMSTGISYSNISQSVTGLSTYTGFAPFIASKGTNDIVVATSAGRIAASNPDIYITDNTADRVSTALGADFFDPAKSNLPFAGTSLLQSFGYLELPLYLRYKLVDRKIGVNILGGVAYSVLVGNSVQTSTFSGEKIFVGQTEGVSPLNISSSMGLGFEYNMPGNLSFTLQPMVKYFISPIGEQLGSSVHPWSAGLFTGFSYRF